MNKFAFALYVLVMSTSIAVTSALEHKRIVIPKPNPDYPDGVVWNVAIERRIASGKGADLA